MASYVRSHTSPFQLENIYTIGPQTVEDPKTGLVWMSYFATTVTEAFLRQGIPLKTVTIEMRRDVETYPFGVKPLIRHYQVTNDGTLEAILNLAKKDLTIVRGFGAGIERHMDDYIDGATQWDAFH